jgi:hypothetical protein
MEALAVLIFPSKMPFSPSLSRIALFFELEYLLGPNGRRENAEARIFRGVVEK